MRLATLLRLQAVYPSLGIAYNAVSLCITLTGNPPLSATNPVAGMLGMAAYAACLIPGFLRRMVIYKVLMWIAIAIFGYFGILAHIIRLYNQPQLYHSIAAWILAVGINVYGLALNVFAVSGRYKS